MKIEWKPISEAPKDRRILLFRPKSFHKIVVGKWEDERFHNNPKPYFSNDREVLEGKRSVRENQPTHFMLLPETPDAE